MTMDGCVACHRQEHREYSCLDCHNEIATNETLTKRRIHNSPAAPWRASCSRRLRGA